MLAIILLSIGGYLVIGYLSSLAVYFIANSKWDDPTDVLDDLSFSAKMFFAAWPVAWLIFIGWIISSYVGDAIVRFKVKGKGVIPLTPLWLWDITTRRRRELEEARKVLKGGDNPNVRQRYGWV